MLDIVGSYHCMQFQGKPIIQTQEDGEKLYFGPVGRKFGAAIFFVFFLFFVFFKNLASSLDIMVGYHHVQYQKKLMI